MVRPRPFPCPVRLILALLAVLPGALRAQEPAVFPPVTDEERALTAVAGEPNAPAVVLFRKGELEMSGYGRFFGSLASHLRVQGRVKILTEEGKNNGELVLGHSDVTRLESFSGRTVLPDGRVLPIPSGARFERRLSKSHRAYVTSVAFPAVQVGAILDYQYELVFRSPLYLEPWYFSDDLPVRYSEIVYRIAKDWKMLNGSRSPLGPVIHQESTDSAAGTTLRAWAENLPSVPADPYGPPFVDLASQMLLLPASNKGQPILDSWDSAARILYSVYDQAQFRNRGVARKARELAPKSATVRQRAEAIYRFVRDEIQTREEPGVGLDPGEGMGEVLQARSGSPAQKALLLTTLLRDADVPSSLVWAAHRDRGAIDPRMPNPNAFDTVLVTLRIDGEDFFLDPSTRRLGFGQLRPGYEGTPALVVSATGAGRVALPARPFQQNLRRAEIDLILDGQGRLAGTGTLRLDGDAALEAADPNADPAAALQSWKDWLGKRFGEFQVSEVKIVQVPGESAQTLTWKVALREEEVLGDEASLEPSVPLGPASQPFVQPAASRKTTVAFDYPWREEVELRLTWPAGWKLDRKPLPAAVNAGMGTFSAAVVADTEKRTLTFRRSFDLFRRLVVRPSEYEEVQALFGAAEKSDGQKIVLVRE
jgi:transglutaminase-like putative cysteine protease